MCYALRGDSTLVGEPSSACWIETALNRVGIYIVLEMLMRVPLCLKLDAIFPQGFGLLANVRAPT